MDKQIRLIPVKITRESVEKAREALRKAKENGTSPLLDDILPFGEPERGHFNGYRPNYSFNTGEE